MDLKRLAEHLGLSQTTVSRALNGHDDVSARTRERVLEAARLFDYRPSGAARMLALGKSDAIGIVHPTGSGDLGDPRFLAVLDGLTSRFAEDGVDVLIASARPSDEVQAYERLLRSRRVDGFIVPHTRIDDARVRLLSRLKAPFVAYGRTANDADHAWFDFDNEAGGHLAVAHLAEAGHRDIAYIHAPLDLTFAHQRHAGFRQGLKDFGLSLRPEWVLAADFSRRGGHEAMGQLLSLPSPPTAVVLDNNTCGIGAVRRILDQGWMPGRDLSVIVYDGMPPDSILGPVEVTSIDQPEALGVGAQLAEMMLALRQGAAPQALQVLWQPVLGHGATVCPPSRGRARLIRPDNAVF